MTAHPGIKARSLLDSAVFPVSAGAVVSEIATVVADFLRSGAKGDIAVCAGVVAVAAALLFQVATRKTR